MGGAVPAGQTTGQLRDVGEPKPGVSVQVSVAFLTALPEVHDKLRLCGPDVGVNECPDGMTLKFAILGPV